MKYLIVVFIFGFSISFLAGVVSGNPFLAILIRSLISGFLLTGLVYGSRYILKKYIPELFEERAGSVEEKADTVADEVDIVIPEENPHDKDTVEMVEEVESGNEEMSDKADSDENVKEESTSINENIDQFSNKGDAGMQTEEELPDVTDIDIGTIDDFGSSVKTKPSKTVQSDLLGTDVDPATLAKAVRSFMKKDEEG